MGTSNYSNSSKMYKESITLLKKAKSLKPESVVIDYYLTVVIP